MSLETCRSSSASTSSFTRSAAVTYRTRRPASQAATPNPIKRWVLPGAGITEQNDRFAGVDERPCGKHGHGLSPDRGRLGEVEVRKPFHAGEPGLLDASLAPAFGPVVGLPAKDFPQ